MRIHLLAISALLLIPTLKASEKTINDVSIISTDSESGIKNDPYELKDDDKILSFSYLTSFGNFTALSIIEGDLAFRLTTDYWLQGFFAQGRGTFDTISENHTENSSASPQSEARFQRLPTQMENFASLGLGVMNRFWLLSKLFKSDSLFETVSGSLTYTIMDESYRSQKYSGFGVKADYTMGYRVTSGIELGTKMSYHIASLKRAELEKNDNSHGRTLSMRWLAVGVETKFIF